jgi:hypothetical protein
MSLRWLAIASDSATPAIHPIAPDRSVVVQVAVALCGDDHRV